MAQKVLPFLRRILALPGTQGGFRRAFATASAPASSAEGNQQAEKKGEDDELVKKRKLIEMECYMLQEMGDPAPSVIPENRWEELLQLPSVSSRRKFFAYLFKSEKAKENDRLRKAELKVAKLQHREDVLAARQANDHIVYGLGQNSYLLKVYDRTIDNWAHHRLANAMKFGQPLVLDMDYDEHMTPREMRSCAEQMLGLFSVNRNNPEPFHLHLCNAREEGTMKVWERFMPTLRQPTLPISISPDCFTKYYPLEKLVYLTPHCREDLTSWDHDAVYIVGAMVDKSKQEPLSLAKAKRLGIKKRRLPLDRYLDWGHGGKALTVNQMMEILLDIKNTGNWARAFSHVPRRKLTKDQPQRSRQLPKMFRNAALKFD